MRKFFTIERVVIYLGLIGACITGLWTFNTRYCSLLKADEIAAKDICSIQIRVTDLEQRDKKIDKIYDYIIKHK